MGSGSGAGNLLKLIAQNFDILAGPVVSLAYPLYASIRAIETKSLADDQQWLTYWILYSMITLFELTFAKLIEWIPFWSYAKLIVTCWLVIPHFSGAAYVYEHYIRPFYTGKQTINICVFNSVTKNDHVKVSVSNKDENKMFGKSESLSAAVSAAPSTTSSQSHGSFFNVTNGFQASTPASSTSTLFGSSAPAFSSTSSFGITSVGPTSEIKSDNSTSGSTTSIFGSSWQQPQQSSGFGSTFTSPSTSVFSFGASSTPASSFGPSVFGNSTPVFGATPNNNINNSNNNNSDQMSMEDSMAEDSMQTQSPVSPFGQAPVSTTTPGFMFGSATPTPTPSLTPAPVSFSFGGQQNQAPAPQNPFQSSSVEFNAGGGSFSLGSGGEKSNRRIVRVTKSKNRKK